MNKKNKFLSLLQYEANRNFNVIILNTLLTMVLSVILYFSKIIVFIEPNTIISNDVIRMGVGRLGINDDDAYIFFLEIFLVIVFSIFIWAREFYFEHKTSYRTLSLPIKRWKIILSKSLIIWLFFGMFLLGQFLAVVIDWFILKMRVISIMDIGAEYLWKAIFTSYSSGWFSMDIVNLIVIFIIIFATSLVGGLVILLKQSFGFKGILIWILYGIVSVALFFYIPVIRMNLFAGEFLILYTVGILIYIGITFGINNYLINKKVSV
ncbi:hypothetical protein [Clostridium sp. B9]|uniref:hypothetical protein n=1 Tax=Clostridium sp. B9 TaxID=3423224 RepID=UPI003D2F0B25